MSRKDIRKSSYYVWSLGVELARGLRGPDVVEEALRKLLLRVSEDVPYDPVKVTLQVSHKGVKVLQNTTFRRSSKPEAKELVPRDGIMFAQQVQDVVAFVVLSESRTQWPLRMHAYRCDSVETAHNLTNHLRVLTGRPEHQQRVAGLEAQLRSQRAPQAEASSESSAGSSSGEMAGLYMSLAAELREKLSLGSKEPLLLPPKDYDTISRQRGNMAAVDLRRGSSRGSSGMDSDHAVSPSKSDEEWAKSLDDDPVPIALTEKKSSNVWRTRGETESELPSRFEQASLESCLIPNITHNRTSADRQRSPTPPSQLSAGKMKSASVSEPVSPHDRFKDAKEKFLLLERESLSKQVTEIGCRSVRSVDTPILSTYEKGSLSYDGYAKVGKNTSKCFNHDIPEERLHHSYEAMGNFPCHDNRNPHENDCVYCQNVRRFRAKSCSDVIGSSEYCLSYPGRSDSNKKKGNIECQCVGEPKNFKYGYMVEDISVENSSQFMAPVEKISDWQSKQMHSNVYEENDLDKSSHRFGRPVGNIGKQMINNSSIIEHGYLSDRQHSAKPGTSHDRYHKPRHEADRNFEGTGKPRSKFGILERDPYRHSHDYVKELKQKSCQDSSCSESSGGEKSELLVPRQGNMKRNPSYQELSDHERFPGLDRETARLQHHNIVNMSPSESNSARNRHSYAELGVHGYNKNTKQFPHHKQLQQTASNASSGRVGLAVVHRF
ncbi:uncharacterized protein LOC134529177 isoform X2 [Bacillus rossius redtenbacheri]